MTTRQDQLPYGIGRFSLGYLLLVGILVVALAWGVYAYGYEYSAGMVVTGLRNIGPMGGATWGLYVAFIIYFVGVSFSGITTAALIRLLHLEHLRAVSRMAELLAVISLILAALTVLADLGQPIRGIVNLFIYARPQSPFFGTFTLVISGYLFASLVYLYLDGRRDAAILARKLGGKGGLLASFYRWWAAGYRDTPAERQRHDRASFWLAIAILPLLVIAHSTLGVVFGLLAGRPGWYTALQAPAFVVMAGVSGLGLLAVVAAVLRRTLNTGGQPALTDQVFRTLGIFQVVLILTYLYFTAVELLTATYAGYQEETRVTLALLTGDYAWLFWGSVASLVLALVFLLLPFAPALRGSIVASTVISGILANLAAIGKRFLIVVPSQTHGMLLPYGAGSYAPTWVEYSVIIGLFALGALLYALFIKVFPIMELPASGEGGH